MEIISFIVVLGIVVLVFRAVGSWMFRIDEVIKNQKIIIQELKKSNENKA